MTLQERQTKDTMVIWSTALTALWRNSRKGQDKNEHKSETRMTASVLKPDPNTEGSKERYLLGQRHNLQIFGVTPICQATKQHSNNS